MNLSLIDFWKIQRKQLGEPCIIRPCHEIKAHALTQLITGTLKTPNLMILEPPRIGKTDLGVKAFVPWALSYFPDSEFILTSYASDLAVSNSLHIRGTLSSEWYRSCVDVEWGARVTMRGDNASGRQDFFHTEQGGSVKAVGMGCGITGFGAGKLREAFGGCIIIDDPLKAQDYRSPAARESAMAYINATLKSRRNRKDNPTTPMVLIMQRLHPQDPAGQLLQQERDQWTVVKIPAINELGESIWPGRIGLEELAMMKDVDPDTYWAQYMQEPSTSKTTIFKPEWWHYWRDRREMEKSITLKIITADTAFEEKTSADWSVFQCWGFVSGAGMVLLDQIRGQWGYPDLTKAVKLFWEKHSSSRPKELGYSVTPATELWIENKASGISIIQTLRSVGIPARKWEPKDKTPKDKVGRAKHSTMPLAAGRIYIPDPKMPGFEWVDRFVNEMTCFDASGSHLNDDQVDAYSEASSIWQERGGGVGPMPFV